MKLGPLLIEMAHREETPPQRSLAIAELGASGTQMAAGLLMQQDYNTDLQGLALYDTYDKMRLADAQVKAGLQAIKLPLLAADWYVEPAGDAPRDQEIAEFVQDGLMNMTASWHDTLRQILLMLDYGTMPFEVVWEIQDGRAGLRKLAPRMPKTISKWYLDDSGGFRGVQQLAIRGNEMTFVDIPPEKMLVFVNEREGSNYRGTSVLRAAYKHWDIKNRLYMIDAIAKAKRGIGIDVGTIKGPDAAARKGDVERALMSLQAHEKQFMVEIEDEFSYRVEGVAAGRTLDVLSSIEYHDTLILRSILAEFISMGTGSTGSLAMHRDKSAFFMLALKGVAQNITHTINSYLIPRWVSMNWTVEAYPRLVHSRLESRDAYQIAQAAGTLLQAGALTANRETEDALRQMLELPRLPEDEAASRRTDRLRRMREEERGVDFARLERALDDSQGRMIRALQEIQQRQIENLQAEATRILETGGRERLEKVEVRYKRELAAAFYHELEQLYRVGREEAAREMRVELALEKGKDILSFLMFRARALANLMGDRLKSAMVWGTLSQMSEANPDPAKVREAMLALSIREAKKAAGFSASEALNLGRKSAAEENKDMIKHATYSALMDSETCSPCALVDGRQFAMDEPELQQVSPPYRECDGKGRCRCVLIYVMR